MGAMLILCVQGPVMWRFTVVRPGAARAICVNDGFRVDLSQVISANWPSALQSIGQHSVALRGAINHITVLPSVIA